MSGLSFNDWDDEREDDWEDTPDSGNKFSSYENTFDDREITSKGAYQIEEEYDEVVGTLEKLATGKYEVEDIKQEQELPCKSPLP